MPLGKYFAIQSRLNDKVLDVSGNEAYDGADVIMYDHHGGDNQLWYADRAAGCIRSKMNENLCLEFRDETLHLGYQEDGNSSQAWSLVGDRIVNSNNSDQVLDIMGECDDNGARVCAYSYHGGNNQQWTYKHAERQLCFIRSRLSDYVLDIEGGDDRPGQSVILWGQKEDMPDNQLWYEDVDGVIKSNAGQYMLEADGERLFLSDGTDQRYVKSGDYIRDLRDTDQVLDVANENKDEGASIVRWSFNGNINQAWTFDYVK